ncbi:rhodanese-like domain-containing protein [Parvibium lacunae]|uniref:Sulfurtransferase n=1 Tax=Parvibium lacunae TaxID=1888893 RepID=A0A368L1H2_9BURK|nr:rhodanese-like domain-containing protein [Parvibium lacunae]RCS57394.1 sulfurtransferase [Parvibium lacunae]
MQQLTALELAAWLQQPDAPLLLDVREPHEYALVHIPGSRLIPLSDLPQQLPAIESWQETAQRPIVCICHHGMRSMQAALYLQNMGLADVINLSGGVHAWATQVDTTAATY